MKKMPVYISDAGCLLIATEVLKNGTVYGVEIGPKGEEEVEWQINDEKRRIGTGKPVKGGYLIVPRKA